MWGEERKSKSSHLWEDMDMKYGIMTEEEDGRKKRTDKELWWQYTLIIGKEYPTGKISQEIPEEDWEGRKFPLHKKGTCLGKKVGKSRGDGSSPKEVNVRRVSPLSESKHLKGKTPIGVGGADELARHLAIQIRRVRKSA